MSALCECGTPVFEGDAGICDRCARRRLQEAGIIDFDDGTRWGLGDTFAGGADPKSRREHGQLIPGFITLRITSAGGSFMFWRYDLAPKQPERVYLSPEPWSGT